MTQITQSHSSLSSQWTACTSCLRRWGARTYIACIQWGLLVLVLVVIMVVVVGDGGAV